MLMLLRTCKKKSKYLYALLDVGKKASQEDIKKAYRNVSPPKKQKQSGYKATLNVLSSCHKMNKTCNIKS